MKGSATTRTVNRTATTPSILALGSQMTPAQRVVWYCLHALVLLVPLATSNFTWVPGIEMPWTFDQFDIVKAVLMRAIVLVAFAAWAWHILVEGGGVRRTKVDYLILAVLAWVTLSTVLSIHPETAFFGKYRRFDGLLSFVTYAVIFFLAVQMLDRATRVRAVARTLFYSGTLVAAYGVLQYLGIDPLAWGQLPFEANRSFSTFGNPNLLGGFIVFPLVISLGLALSESNQRWRIAYWCGFGIIALCWVTAFTRGAWIAGAIGLAVLVFAAWRHRTRLTVVDWTFSGAIAAFVAIVVVRSLAVPDQVMNVWIRLVSIFQFGEGSALTRFQIWDAAWRATLDRPIFGFGPDTFRLIFPQYKPVEYVQVVGHLSVADNAHNYILHLMAGIGIPGMLLLYGLFIAVAALSARIAFARPALGAASGANSPEAGRLVMAAFWAACVAYVVHLSFGISVTGSTFLLWLAMAALMAPGARTVTVRPPAWGGLAASASLAVLLVASVGNIVYLVADHHYLYGRFSGSYDERVANAERAVALNPFNDMYRAEVGVAHSDAFTQLLMEANAMRSRGEDPSAVMAQAEQIFLRAEAALLETIAFVPEEYDNYIFLTSLYNRAGDTLNPMYFQRALDIGRRGVALSEHGPMVRLQYAVALLSTGDPDEARRQLEISLEHDPRFVEANAVLADILMGQGEPAAALVHLRRAQEYRPGMPGVEALIESAEAQVATQ